MLPVSAFDSLGEVFSEAAVRKDERECDGCLKVLKKGLLTPVVVTVVGGKVEIRRIRFGMFGLREG